MIRATQITNARIAQWIRRNRERIGLTQYQLAKKIICRQPTVSSWENGLHRPTPRMIRILHAVFNQ